MENQYFSRWYDKDPVLSMSMRTLANSSDERQIAVALNLIKVIIEHNIQDNKYENVEDIISSADFAYINQESPFAGEERGYSGYPSFNSPDNVGFDLAEI